jgi:hypothetical protein
MYVEGQYQYLSGPRIQNNYNLVSNAGGRCVAPLRADLKLSWDPEVSGPPRKRVSSSRSRASADRLSNTFVPMFTNAVYRTFAYTTQNGKSRTCIMVHITSGGARVERKKWHIEREAALEEGMAHTVVFNPCRSLCCHTRFTWRTGWYRSALQLTWVFLLVEARARNGNFAAFSSTQEIWNLKHKTIIINNHYRTTSDSAANVA